MAELIYVDENGAELRRETKGKGRPPRGAVKQENGDFLVAPIVDETFHPEYLDVDAEGNVLSRSPKGRGRAKPGYEKQEGGVLSGHWVKVVSDETETPEVKEKDGTVTDANDVSTVAEEASTNSEVA